jgi:hypothetical protein
MPSLLSIGCGIQCQLTAGWGKRRLMCGQTQKGQRSRPRVLLSAIYKMRDLSCKVLLLPLFACAMQQSAQDRFCFSYRPRCIESSKDVMGARISRACCMRHRRQRTGGACSLQLPRMSGSDDEPQLLGSRRIAKFFLSLGIDFFRDDGEPRLFGSRRLAQLANPNVFNESRTAAETLTSPDQMGLQWNASLSKTPSADESRPAAETIEIDSSFQRPETRRTQSLPGTPRPNLPQLSEAELSRLLRGERVQKQARDGRFGNGLVVVDVNAEPATVFAVLADINRSARRTCSSPSQLHRDAHMPS